MQPLTRKRRSPEQWQAVVDDYVASGLSGTQFCQQNEVQYASFCKWRQRLLSTPEKPEKNDTPAFVDFSALNGTRGSSWHITLKLGNGVELVLRQA